MIHLVTSTCAVHDAIDWISEDDLVVIAGSALNALHTLEAIPVARSFLKKIKSYFRTPISMPSAKRSGSTFSKRQPVAPGVSMSLQLDSDGYLKHLSDWDESAALELAAMESIELHPAHWELIELVRRYYAEFDHAPAMRPLVKWIKLEAGPEKGNSIYLHKLFPVSPAKQLARVSGLPKPTKCL